eukprot:TRINITY_DN9740_c0_g1_i1.p1 TRINITY_DN9740_c0_g1~~TRINITY_DN9740_c0_g1_i1.p1  ORF type:complete len:511 (-),score=70.51 TRINITY_DN9740_c0_g1_i1:147-1679(-)
MGGTVGREGTTDAGEVIVEHHFKATLNNAEWDRDETAEEVDARCRPLVLCNPSVGDEDEGICVGTTCAPFGLGPCAPTPGKKKAAAKQAAERPRRCTAIQTFLAQSYSGVVCAFDDDCVGAVLWLNSDGSELTLAAESDARLGEIRCLSFDCGGIPNSTAMRFCSGSDFGQLALWNLNPKLGLLEQACSWKAHEQAPTSVATYSGVTAAAMKNGTLVSGGGDGCAGIWSYNTDGKKPEEMGSLQSRYEGAHGGAITAVSVGLPIAHAATAGEDGRVQLWSETGGLLAALPAHGRDVGAGSTPKASRIRPNSVVVDAIHSRLCTGSEDGYVRLWDLTYGKPTRRLCHSAATHAETEEAKESRSADALSPRSSLEQSRATDLGSEFTLDDAASSSAGGGKAKPSVRGVTFDAGGEQPTSLLSVASDGSWRLWDVRTSRPEITRLRAHRLAISSASMSGSRIVTGSTGGASAAIWDVRKVDTPLHTNCFHGLRPMRLNHYEGSYFGPRPPPKG